jgi:hypothetical protein
VDALYRLHPRPYSVMQPVLQHIASEAGLAAKADAPMAAGGERSREALSRLSRFCFLVGHCAVNQLVRKEKGGGARERERETTLMPPDPPSLSNCLT